MEVLHRSYSVQVGLESALHVGGGGMVDPGRICAANMWRGGGVVKILTQVLILQMEQL